VSRRFTLPAELIYLPLRMPDMLTKLVWHIGGIVAGAIIGAMFSPAVNVQPWDFEKSIACGSVLGWCVAWAALGFRQSLIVESERRAAELGLAKRILDRQQVKNSQTPLR